MTALYAAVDMRAPANMLTRPEPKLRDKLDAVGIVKSLLAHGANPNIRLKKPIIGRHQNLVGDGQLAEGATPLARAAKASDLRDDEGAARRRRRRDADAREPDDDGDARGRRDAPEPKALEAVKLLVDHGVDVNAFNANGQTILHNAAQRGHNRSSSTSPGKGAKLDRRDKQGRTAARPRARRRRSRAAAQGRAADGRAPVNEKTAALLRELMQKK